MPTKSWRKSLSVIERLIASPKEFSFVQAVRLLERATVFKKKQAMGEAPLSSSKTADNAVARYSPPNKELVVLKSSQNLDFPDSEVSAVKIHETKSEQGNEQWQLMMNFIGLTGTMGVMPFHYTELILQRLKKRDRSLSDFVDMFNHRTTSLFYQASNKYRLPIEYERTKLFKHNKSEDSPHTQALLSLLGLGTAHLRNRQHLRDESILFYSGIFSQQVKTETGLQQLIQSYFGVPAHVESFIGEWQELIDDVRTKLPDKKNRKGQNVCLGKSTMLGKKGWFAQGKSHVKIGPLNKEQFEKFSPSTGSLTALNELVSSYLGMEQSFDFVIQVDRDNVPNKVALEKENPPQLAWNAWLSGKPKTKTKKDDLLEITVSSKAGSS